MSLGRFTLEGNGVTGGYTVKAFGVLIDTAGFSGFAETVSNACGAAESGVPIPASEALARFQD